MSKAVGLRDPETELPLTPAVYHILVALADGEKHGYAIMQTVEADTGGSLQMGAGTLYGSLDRMLKARLVEETEGEGEGPHSDRRRYYRLTGFGGLVLRAEMGRLEKALGVARKRSLKPRLGMVPA